MFHLLADDTGASAVWAAQRVPDDHITAVANQFVIGEIDIADTANFMASGKSLYITAVCATVLKPLSKFQLS